MVPYWLSVSMIEDSVEFRVVPIRPSECVENARKLVGEDYWLFLGICIVGMMVGSAGPMGILLGPMMCGIHICYRNRDRGRPVRFEMLFKGFDHFLEGLVASVIIVCAMTAVIMPAYFLMFFGMLGFGFPGRGGPGNLNIAFGGMLGLMAIFYTLLIVATMLMDAITMFAFPLIVDRKMKGIDALKLSAKAAWANRSGVLGLVLLVSVIQLLGMLLCVIPGILFIPYRFAAYHLAYDRVFSDYVPMVSPQDQAEFRMYEEPTSIRERDFVD